MSALGFVSVFDQVLEGLPKSEQEAVFKAYVEALDEDPKRARSDAEAWEAWVKGMSGEPPKSHAVRSKPMAHGLGALGRVPLVLSRHQPNAFQFQIRGLHRHSIRCQWPCARCCDVVGSPDAAACVLPREKVYKSSKNDCCVTPRLSAALISQEPLMRFLLQPVRLVLSRGLLCLCGPGGADAKGGQ